MKKRSLAALRRKAESIAREAKSLVALAFRNGPIEDVHSGEMCPTCRGETKYSHITQAEMRLIMKTAVDRVYSFLMLKETDPALYQQLMRHGERFTQTWDEPDFITEF